MTNEILLNIKKKICNHPLMTIAVIGIIIRLLMIPVTLVYDSNYWAIVIRNIETGSGLYELEGYYYTPVWGYFLGLISAFQSAFLDLGEMGIRSAEALSVEVPDMYLTANVTSISFLYSIKIPLMIIDLILSYLIYILVKEVTGDEKKSIIAFALTFICPSLLAATIGIAMPDGISAVFLVLTILLIRHDQPFFAGMCYSVSVLNKFFPAFLFFVILAYMISKYMDDKKRMRNNLLMAIAGGIVMSAILFIPQLLDGTIQYCFTFLSDRSGFSAGESPIELVTSYGRLILYSLVIIASVWMSYDLIKNRTDDQFRKFMIYCLTVIGLCFLYPPATQYLVIMTPVVAYFVVVESKKYIRCWILLSVGGFFMTYASTGTTLLPLAVYTNMFSVTDVVNFFNMTMTEVIGPINIFMIIYFITAVIQYSGIVLTLWYIYNDHFRKKNNNQEASVEPKENPDAEMRDDPMTNLMELYRKYEEIILYLIFGFLTLVVNWSAYAIFVQCCIEINLSNILSWIVSVSFAFVVNKWFVFKSKLLVPIVVLRELGSFFAARIITGVIAIVLFPIVYALGMDQTIFGVDGFAAKIFTTVLEIILNWAFSKFLIFNLSKKKEKNEN